MTNPLFAPLISAAINLAGLWLIYSLMAYMLVQLCWNGRGLVMAIITILVAELFWILPATFFGALFYFGNSIATAGTVIILSLRATSIPRQLENTARMDGFGWFGVYWNVILPYVRRELTLIMPLALAVTVFPVLAMMIAPDNHLDPQLHVIEAALGMASFPRIAHWALASLIVAPLPIFMLFLARQDRTGRICEPQRN